MAGPALVRRGGPRLDGLTDLGPRAVSRGRRSGRARLVRLRQRGWQIVQCALAAAAAWWVASELLGHARPFFAPVAAVVALGVSYERRLRRVGEVVVGVAVGVAVGDLFVSIAGTGVWQIALVIAVAMSLAVLLDAGALLVTQAGVQAVIVTTLLPNPEAGLGRWLDAVVGGAVALVAAAVVPASPLRRPRQLAAGMLDELADLLHAAADAARSRDSDMAGRALEQARRSQASLDQLRSAAREGLDVVRVSPFRRRHRPQLQGVVALAEPLDRSVRNVRVLLRRVVAATSQREEVPEPLATLVQRLSAAVALMAADLAADRPPDDAVTALERIASESATVPRSSLSGDVVLAQVRSIVVDLLQVAGMPPDDAAERVRQLIGPP